MVQLTSVVYPNYIQCGAPSGTLQTILEKEMHAFNAPYLHFCLSSDSKNEPKCTLRINNKQTRHLNHAHSIMSMQ